MHVLPKIVQGENVKQTSPELYQIAVQHMRELTEECKCQK